MQSTKPHRVLVTRGKMQGCSDTTPQRQDLHSSVKQQFSQPPMTIVQSHCGSSCGQPFSAVRSQAGSVVPNAMANLALSHAAVEVAMPARKPLLLTSQIGAMAPGGRKATGPLLSHVPGGLAAMPAAAVAPPSVALAPASDAANM